MKIDFRHAVILLIAGLVVLVCGAFLEKDSTLSHTARLVGLVLEFLGTVWLVLYLNHRRKNKTS